jgi:tRNA-dihydrouridine synthase A
MSHETPGTVRDDHRLSVAPMMDCTDRHCRRLVREITRRTRLYTEMITAAAIKHGDRDRLLRFSPEEHPVALQLGGADPDDMALAAACGAEAGYDEININVGCPSDRVQAGRFGACLMAEPDTVAACVAAMQRASGLPVTVKTRIGIDDRDRYEDLRAFVEPVAEAGCTVFIIHARKAWLTGLSPKQNRQIPPLRHEVVYRLKADYPALTVVINGGLMGLDAASEALARVDGAMIGRAAYADPFILADADRRIFGETASRPKSRHQVVQGLLPYIDAEMAAGTRLSAITRHMLSLFQGIPGAKAWRRRLTEGAPRTETGSRLVADALALVAEPETSAAA